MGFQGRKQAADHTEVVCLGTLTLILFIIAGGIKFVLPVFFFLKNVDSYTIISFKIVT